MAKGTVILTAVLLALFAGSLLPRSIGNTFPGISSVTVAVLLVITFLLPGLVVVRRIRQGRLFSLLTFYSLLFLLEIFVGGIISTLAAPLLFKSLLPADRLTPGLTVAMIGYAIFLVGYGLKESFGMPREPDEKLQERDNRFFYTYWSGRYQVLYFIFLYLATAASYTLLVNKVIYAGGITQYAENAYQFRFGTYTQTDQQNTIVLFFSMFGNSALPLLGIGLVAWWTGYLRSNWSRALFILVAILLSARLLLSGFRSTTFMPLLSVLALYDSRNRLSVSRLTSLGIMLGLVLIMLNYGHRYMYFLTAGAEQIRFVETVQELLAPQNHLLTLVRVLDAGVNNSPLRGQGFLESIFYFIPRLVWQTKLSSQLYGSLLVQNWAGLPNWYQMAVTNIGELIAHFGPLGLIGMLLYGRLYRWLDSMSGRDVELRAALCFLLLPRVLVDVGMGLAAVSVTLVNLAVFLSIAFCLRYSTANRPAGSSHASTDALPPHIVSEGQFARWPRQTKSVI